MSEPAAKKARKSTLPPSTVNLGQSAVPLARVGKVVKADRDVRICSKEAIFLISKATELMLGKLTTQAYHNARMDKRQKMIRYDDLAAATHNNPEWFYLGEVVPRHMTLREALDERRKNEDLADAPAAVTTKAPDTGAKQPRVKKGKGAKIQPKGAAVPEVVGPRKTRGKKLKLPAGEGGPDEEDDFEDEEYSEPAGPSRAPSEAGMEVDQ
ncbi:hypothetical protein JCM10213_009088 [Rhodosporidiobolus nylandii]